MTISHPLIGVLVLGSLLPAAAATPSQYAGETAREIKALAPAEVSDLLSGKGMGFARAA